MNGKPGPLPLDPYFADGQALLPSAEYPEPKAVVAAWRTVLAESESALASAMDADFDKPSLPKLPTFDGRVGGALAAGAFHESYHLGQLGYLTKWLGYERLLNR